MTSNLSWRFMDMRSADWALLFASSVVLAVMSTWSDVQMLSAEYVGAGPQLQRHIEIMQGEAGSPWQYRIMSVWLSEWSFSIASALGANYHVFWGFVGLRVLQLCAVFIAFYAYLRACRLGAVSAYLGLMVLAWSISHSVFDSDLAFHSFFDLLFYLVAMLLLISGRAWWLPAVMLVATLNRETSGMIAFLPLAYLARDADKQTITTTAMIAAASLMVYAIAFFGLRAYFPPQGSVLAYGHEPGLALIQYNLVRWMTWVRLVETFSLVPVIALLGYRVWPDFLKQLFWLLVPVWLAVHLWGGVLIETRLLLVPFALVLVPGALYFLEHSVVQESTAKLPLKSKQKEGSGDD